MAPPRVGLPALSPREPDRWFEPELPAALADLPEKQRVVLSLLHGHQWTLAEVADLLGVSKGTVQSYADRGLRRLRRRMKVDS